MYYLFYFASRILPRFPRRFIRTLGNVLGVAAWLIAIKARGQATKNILHVLGAQVGETRAGRRRLRRTVRAMFVHNTHNYLELFTLRSLSPEKALSNMDFSGSEHLDAALARGKGVIIVGPHLGPFDYIVQYLSIKGYDVTVPVEALEDARMLQLMLDLRRSHGIWYVPLTGSSLMRAIVQKLRANKVVVIVADRAVEGKSVEVNFFGAPARLPDGPIRLAQRTGAALLNANCYRTPSGLAIGQLLPFPLALPDEQRIDRDTMMQAFISMTEASIREHPEQWIAFSPIWLDDVKNDS